ncbi:MAG: rhodanese-related sulfurtransferase [Oceanicoccus sp.]|jgi:rhodanese-related sulfurtransferase
MTIRSDSACKRYIEQFSPLNQISDIYRGQFACTLDIISIASGEPIVRKLKRSSDIHFLIKGAIEVRQSFEQRLSIDHSSAQCQKSLESLLDDRGSIKAVDDCTILVVKQGTLEQFLSWSLDSNIYHNRGDELSLESVEKIDDSYQEDWDSAFVKSPLAANLPGSEIHKLLLQLENIEVQCGDTIVKNHSVGDYFYVVKEGVAQVQTERSGPHKGATFELTAGNYFGDEALVADTIRNASVTMLSDGILGRLNADAFNRLIKRHLVTHLTPDVHVSSDELQMIDVRLPIEFRADHKEGSNNIPISALRNRLTNMKQSLLYVVTPANDSRSELATYLLRQAGFQAYQCSELVQEKSA